MRCCTRRPLAPVLLAVALTAPTPLLARTSARRASARAAPATAGAAGRLRARGAPAPSADSAGLLTLQAALAEARHANARLPVARMQLQGAVARTRQAHGLLYPTLSVDGDVHAGAPQAYASSDALLRVLAQAPLYEGGELRAGLAQSRAAADATQAGYRMAVRDVDYAVRVGYSRVLRADSSLAFRRRSLQRLQSYLAVVQARQASGQGVSADVLRTRQRLAAARGDIAALTRERDEARMALNDLLGRTPEEPLTLTALAAPAPPPDTVGQPWLTTPDVAQSQAQVRAAQAGIRAARAGRRPHVSLEADAGAQPVLGSTTALLNNGTGWGAQVLLSFSLPFWDNGIYRGRMDEATAALGAAQKQEVVVRRASRLAWTRAAADVADLYGEYQARDTAASVARDAYLQAESLYRGGQGTALEVLDAYDAWIQADQNLLNVIYDYRAAQADLYRWGNP